MVFRYLVRANRERNDLYGIKNLDGRTILEPSLTSLYTRENGRHA